MYSEANGVAELDVLATAPLLARFSNNGRTIVLAGAPTAAANSSGRKASCFGEY